MDLGRLLKTDAPFEPDLLLRPLDIQELELGPAYLCMHLRAFTVSLRSDSLRVLRVLHIDSGESVRALGKLLKHAGGNIITLEIDLSLPVTPSGRVGWVDPLKDNWQKLHVSTCTKLESIFLPVFLGYRKQPVGEPIVGILSQVPPTLRKVTIYATGLCRLMTVQECTAYKVNDLDEALSPIRFPHLQQCLIQECPDWAHSAPGGYWPKCVSAVRRALKGLHERRLLTMVGDDSDSE
ncbi:hypothetical protein L227DRAFT_292488 [Lentinus tigrinus ALCF2SS1-6]|uniref:F-box domain-containing protein n=1 Tax=Lentinus tigrinus ALCF2SS1-6 TaxID=1328759 RepID=A0A5C2RYG3_9APHY|nr:hypothetical protein L227DRAFT_292488 [Lentinus tigrinus ALCF2SS1-6]